MSEDLFKDADKLTVIYKTVTELLPYARNAKIHDQQNVEEIAASIRKYGFNNPVLIDENGEIIAGHGRVLAAQLLGLTQVPCIVLAHLNDAEKKAYRLADNRLTEKSKWDIDALAEELSQLAEDNFDMLSMGFTYTEIESLLKNDPALLNNDHWQPAPVVQKTNKLPDTYGDQDDSGALFKKFIIPPFSVLNAQSQYWQARKKMWTARIGDLGESRKQALGKSPLMDYIGSGVSILDPVLAELVSRWFALPGHKAFDPFAGDTVFGFVAASSGLQFTGIELRPEQAEVNQERVTAADLKAVYHCDDGANMDKYIKPNSQDLLFTCPPYADLEVYSDNPADLSNMTHADFFQVYEKILTNTYSRLKNNRFAVVVTSEVRNKATGNYINLVSKTNEIMQAAGYTYYNEIILLQTASTLPLRIGRQFNAGRKIGRIHQNVLIYFKGDTSKIKDIYGAVITDDELETLSGGEANE